MLEPLPKDKAELDARFSDLYRAHLRDVYSYSYYRVGNHHDAEDLTEQTFLQAYRHYERALRESDGRPLRPWLIRIAHNLAANLAALAIGSGRSLWQGRSTSCSRGESPREGSCPLAGAAERRRSYTRWRMDDTPDGCPSRRPGLAR